MAVDTAAPAVHRQIDQLHREVSEFLNSSAELQGRPPAAQIYKAALAKADAALELAEEHGVVGLRKQHCLSYQRLCTEPLELALSKTTDRHERAVYDRATGRSKRHGVLFAVDKGEHVAAVLAALQLEAFLDQQKQDEEEAEVESQRSSDASAGTSPSPSSPSGTRTVRFAEKVEEREHEQEEQKRSRFHEELQPENVRMVDAQGNRTETKSAPALKKRGAQRFDGWKNVI
ncbi:Uu.00g099040.m01.CDS01 [Anthostomella pinea]|uniref:Uu.00g099040.m01.CDS01 n=1 Tax=Anthostomella pinea TaxID=933095 RepID=A0AAI8VDQ0_9PEZI|nr:Uu.00g099040.m01.CDS01 [Anthostomella pinea]